MTPDLDTLLTALYVKIDDELKGIPRAGCPPRFTDSELVTVAVAQVLLGHDSERGWIRAAPQAAQVTAGGGTACHGHELSTTLMVPLGRHDMLQDRDQVYSY